VWMVGVVFNGQRTVWMGTCRFKWVDARLDWYTPCGFDG